MALVRFFRSQSPTADAPLAEAGVPTATHAKAACRDKARVLVHKYAAFGTAWSLLPIPMATSAGLTALETHMIYWIARVYGEEPSRGDVLMTAAGLELCSVALKTVAIEGALLVPGIGWGIKATIAAGAIEAIGNAIIQHYEQKYPGKAA
jgi:uncharacterized protein (DUF697 family)